MHTLGQILRGIGFLGTILSGVMVVLVLYLILFQSYFPALIPAAIIAGTFAGSLGAIFLGDSLKKDED